MTRHRTLAVLCLAVALLCGCHAAGGLFTPAEDGATSPITGQPVPKTPITGQPEAPAQTIIREVLASSGFPWGETAGGLASLVLGAFIGRKGAKKDTAEAIAAKDREEWTEEDIGSLTAALKARGWKMERAS